MNTFGRKLTLTTFGESHAAAIGGVLDGFPAGVRIDLNFIQSELDKRKPGGSKFATARSEGDRVEILSGVFEGVSTGTPIGFIIRNENQKSGDYENLRELFRPGHADYAYYRKYGIRDIPKCILISPDGKVISFTLMGIELFARVKQILSGDLYYLRDENAEVGK